MATVAGAGPSRGYEIKLLLLFTLTNGVVGVDRLAASYLSPYIVAELKLSNTQIGMMASALSLAIAISALLLSRLADSTGRRKTILIACTVWFSLFSALGGLAGGFTALLVARFALGLGEGPMVPISQTILAEASAPQRRGLNMGFMQMTGAFLLGGMLGPVVATQIADAYGWRAAFFVSGIPGLLLALLIGLALRRDTPLPAAARSAQLPLGQALAALARIPNMRAVVAVAVLMSAWLMVQNAFLPLILTQMKGLSGSTMGWVIGMGGISGVVAGTLLPGLSDRLGRRPVVAVAAFFAVFAPLALLFLPPDPVLLGIAILIGWLPLGIAPLFCAVIPTESVPPALAATAIGLSMGMAELLGGVLAPSLAGSIADGFGLSAILWICAGFALAAGVIALKLQETAPALRAEAI